MQAVLFGEVSKSVRPQRPVGAIEVIRDVPRSHATPTLCASLPAPARS